MGIDWFTFIAQIVNFLILIGLLWHFAYKPITRAMDEREESIRNRLDEAQRKRDEAERKSRELDEQRQELEDQREEKLAGAREEAEQRRKELVAEARERVQRDEQQWRESLERQQDELAEELQRRAGRYMVSATRQLVRRLADAELEAEIVGVFEKRLAEIGEDTRKALRQALAEGNGEAQIITAFELAEEQRDELRKRLSELIEEEANPTFEIDDELLCGIELRTGDQRVAWTAEEYLGELREEVETAVSRTSQKQSVAQTGERQAGEEQAGDEKKSKEDAGERDKGDQKSNEQGGDDDGGDEDE